MAVTSKRLVFLTIVLMTLFSTSGSAVYFSPLPAPHGNLQYFGYYFDNSKWGNFTSDTFAYTDTYVAITDNAVDLSNSDWETPLAAQIATAANAGKQFFLLMKNETKGNQTYTWDDILDVAAPYWSSVAVVIIHDDDGTNVIASASALNSDITTLRGKFSAHSLSDRPIMANFGINQSGNLSNGGIISAAGLDIVGINAFLGEDGLSNVSEAQEAVDDALTTALDQVANAGKEAVIVGQSFDRGGAWAPHLLAGIQETFYDHAANDSTVIGLLMFAYYRNDGGGVTGHPGLIYHHQRMAWAIGIGSPMPGCYGNHCLAPDTYLGPDDFIESPNGRYRLVYQGDGNLVLYDVDDSWAVLWASNTASATTGVAYMQGDGNLVIYDAGNQPVFASNTSSYSGAWLFLHDSGHAAISDTGLDIRWIKGPIWSW